MTPLTPSEEATLWARDIRDGVDRGVAPEVARRHVVTLLADLDAAATQLKHARPVLDLADAWERVPEGDEGDLVGELGSAVRTWRARRPL